MMDIYHPDFRDTIALDVRVNKFLTTFQLTFRGYREKESFYVSAAHKAGLNGWQLDRMLFKCTDEVLAALEWRFSTVCSLQKPIAHRPRAERCASVEVVQLTGSPA
jgi:hypothetical protein